MPNSTCFKGKRRLLTFQAPHIRHAHACFRKLLHGGPAIAGTFTHQSKIHEIVDKMFWRIKYAVQPVQKRYSHITTQSILQGMTTLSFPRNQYRNARRSERERVMGCVAREFHEAAHFPSDATFEAAISRAEVRINERVKYQLA